MPYYYCLLFNQHNRIHAVVHVMMAQFELLLVSVSAAVVAAEETILAIPLALALTFIVLHKFPANLGWVEADLHLHLCCCTDCCGRGEQHPEQQHHGCLTDDRDPQKLVLLSGGWLELALSK
jgi:hypothetical protein